MPTWLDADTAKGILGSAATNAEAAPLQKLCDGVRPYVEDRRPDLFVAQEDPEEAPVFTPTADVVTGAAFLAWRLYARRSTPLGVLGATEDGYSGILREDPDIARLLGIGRSRRFVFGGSPPVVDEAAV